MIYYPLHLAQSSLFITRLFAAISNYHLFPQSPFYTKPYRIAVSVGVVMHA